MNETTWIKFSDQKPTEKDLPLITWNGKERSLWTVITPDFDTINFYNYTHWRSLPKDLPVVVNEDEEAMSDCWKVEHHSRPNFYAFNEGWKSALAWERSRRKP